MWAEWLEQINLVSFNCGNGHAAAYLSDYALTSSANIESRL